MPYTKQESRTEIKRLAEKMSFWIHASGDLTYAITLLMHLETLKAKQSYTNMSRIRATAQDSADEYYRAVMAKYEDEKRAENGPVSELDNLDTTAICDICGSTSVRNGPRYKCLNCGRTF